MKVQQALMIEVLHKNNTFTWINSKYLHHSLDSIKMITGEFYIIEEEELKEIADNVVTPT